MDWWVGLFKSLRFIEQIDNRICRSDPRCLVSTGTAVSAMILNGLGFTNRRLYLVGQFFSANRTRVPETINDAAILVEKIDSDLSWMVVDENYKYHAEESWFDGVPQRLLLVFSQKAYEREKMIYDQRVEKEKVAFEKELQKLAKIDFGCEKDARKTYEDLKRKNRLFSAPIQIDSVVKYAKPGRPKKGQDASVLVHRIIVGELVKNQAVYEETLRHKGRFILATNQLDRALLPDKSILAKYKGQQHVERGPSFLKDPWFLIDSVFLKNIRPQLVTFGRALPSPLVCWLLGNKKTCPISWFFDINHLDTAVSLRVLLVFASTHTLEALFFLRHRSHILLVQIN